MKTEANTTSRAQSRRSRQLAGVLLLPCLLGFVGCSDSHEDIYAETVAVQRSVAETIATVEDEASAEAAAEQLRELRAELDRIESRAAALGPPSAEQKLALDEQYADQIAENREAIQESLREVRVAGAALLEPLRQAWPGLKLEPHK